MAAGVNGDVEQLVAKSRALELASDFLGKSWSSLTEDDITVSVIR